MSFFLVCHFFWYVVFFVYIKKDMPTFSWFLTAMEVTSHYQKHTTSVDVQHVVFRHASVSSTYPCPSLRLLVRPLVRPLVTLSDFQSLVALSKKWKVKSEKWKHTTPHHSTPLHTTQLHTTPHHSTPHHSTPLHTTPHHSTPLHTTPHHSTPLLTTKVTLFCREISCVAIYAFFGVKFWAVNECRCQKNDKYEVCISLAVKF